MNARVLVSACLLGRPVRYDGRASTGRAKLDALHEAGRVVWICPEVSGGLAVPRPPAEIVGGDGTAVLAGTARVLTRDGADVTHAFLAGAQATLALAQAEGVRVAVLKARSPSCGNAQIYDGSHSGTLVDGLGITAALLQSHGIRVLNEDELDALDEFL